MQSIEQQRLANLLAYKNHLIAQMEAIAGLPGLFPKCEIPQPIPIINKNINVTNSTVGTINNGYIQSLNVNISKIAGKGQEELATQLKEFAEKIIEEKHLTTEIKNEILEQVEFLSNQLAAKQPLKKGIIKSVLNYIPNLISTSESLLNLWNMLSEKISTVL